MHLRTGKSKQKEPSCGKFRHSWYVTSCEAVSQTSSHGNSKRYNIGLACRVCPVTKSITSKKPAIEGSNHSGLSLF